MLGSLLRRWRLRAHFSRHFGFIRGIIALEDEGFSYIPWSYGLWESLQDRLAPLELYSAEQMESAVRRRLPIRELVDLAPPESVRVLTWEDVREIWTYKIDLFTVDSICLTFFRWDESGIEVTEECWGWRELLDLLPARFPGIPSDWWLTVAFPAFATNAAKIWEALSARVNSR